MKKELLTVENIRQDLQSAPKPRQHRASLSDRCIPLSLLASILGAFLWETQPYASVVMIVIAATCVALIVFKAIRERRREKQEVIAFETAPVVVTVEELISITKETVTDYGSGKRRLQEKTVFCFASGRRWTLPRYGELYAWSEDLSMSPTGVENTSLCGDKFYFAEREGFPGAACVYNTKMFVYLE